MPVPAWFAETLERELRPWVSLSSDQVTQLYRHYELLESWNKSMNLTRVKSGVETVVRHYCESLFFGQHVPSTTCSTTIVDIGSGAGFPGVPVAILNPEWRITLVESNQRKAVFLREATRHISNVTVLPNRAEEVTTRFDWAVARAVEPSDVLGNIPRLADGVGLMLGESAFELLPKTSIAWSDPIRLPWGDRRICAYGRVSRGTSH
jgi:16S rRNA (guanine527-N7)-methyltransferase